MYTYISIEAAYNNAGVIYMKKEVLYGGVILSFILMLVFSSSFVQAKKISKEECFERFNDEVIQDVKSSFSELKVLDNPNDPVQEYTHSDLDKAMMATGGTAGRYIDSVQHLFQGTFKGFPRFFVAQPDGIIGNDKYESAFVGYFLYQTSDNINGMVKMRPGKTGWDIVEKKEVKGKVIPWKCGK